MAFLQSTMGAPVRFRNSFNSSIEIDALDCLVFVLCVRPWSCRECSVRCGDEDEDDEVVVVVVVTDQS